MNGERFVAPRPETGETHDGYLTRLTRELERWVNAPIELTIADDLVREAARQQRPIQVKIGLPYSFMVTLDDRHPATDETLPT